MFQRRSRSTVQWVLSIRASTATRSSSASSAACRRRTSRGASRDDAWHSVCFLHIAAPVPRNTHALLQAPGTKASIRTKKCVDPVPTYHAAVRLVLCNPNRSHKPDFWSVELKIGTSVTPALRNVHINFKFAAPLGACAERTDGRTGKTRIAASYDGRITSGLV